MRIAVTGHRPNKLGNEYGYDGTYTAFIKNELQIIIDQYNPTQMISGMAQGVDTIWAVLAIKNKIPLVAAIPCVNHDAKWPQKAKDIYATIIKRASKSHYVNGGAYTNTCMQDRNMWMVDNCDILVAIWDGSSGGTANCVRYARSLRRQIKIIIIDPKP